MLDEVSARSTLLIASLFAATMLWGCGDGESYPMPEECAVRLAQSAARGPEDALVTIVEFADFECPYCGRVQPTLDELDERYEGELRWVFKHLPLAMHAHSFDAAIAAECAKDQDRFWEMSRALFEQQANLSGTLYASIAESLELDMNAWQDCYDSAAPEEQISADVNLAIEYGVGATPTFFVNGIPVVGAAPLSRFRSAVENALTDARESGMGGAEYYTSLVELGCQ